MGSTFLAQVVLTLRSVFSRRDGFMLITAERNRIYAVTNKNRKITSCFGVVMVSQLTVGIYLTAYTAKTGGESVTKHHPWFLSILLFSAQPIIPIPLQIYMVCNFVGPRIVNIVFPIISVVYVTIFFLFLYPGDTRSDNPPDVLAFSVIVYLVVRSNVYKAPIPSLLRIIARDATYYFLFIFTSHLVVVMFLVFANVRILS